MRPGLIPPVPLEQARAASKAVADEALVAEVAALHAEVRDLTEALRAMTAGRNATADALTRITRESADWSALARAQAAELTAVTAERDLLRTAAQRIDRCIETGDPDRGSREFTAALDQLIFALEVDPDELAASMARHPAGKRLGQP